MATPPRRSRNGAVAARVTPQLAENVVLVRRPGRSVAFDLDGGERWEIEGSPDEVVLGDETVVVVDGDRATADG